MINATETLIDQILSQEQYARRKIILKDPEVMTIFWEKDHEVRQLVHSIDDSQLGKIDEITAFKRLHQQYNELLTKALPAAAGTGLLRPAKCHLCHELTIFVTRLSWFGDVEDDN